MRSRLKICLSILLVATVSLTSSSSQVSGANYDEVANKVASQCASFGQIKTLEAFGQFYANYAQLNSCLRQPASKAQHLDKCRESEQVCQDNGLLFSSVGAIGNLLTRLQKIERTCTIEYAIRLYRLARRLSLAEPSGKGPLTRVLRHLGQLWSSRCRQTAANRLREVEQRAPEANKHLMFILGIMNYGLSDAEANSDLHLELEDFVPVLEDELQQESDISFSTKRQPWSGFEFRIEPTVRLALNGAQMSCRSLKPYYVNILGSLGLVASVGLGATTSSADLNMNAQDKRRVQHWLMAATLCQSLSTVVKMSKVSNEGKTSSWVKFVPIREADVSGEKERDQEFATYRLDELKKAPDLKAERLDEPSEPAYPEQASSLRKLQMVEGPNERMASAILAFLDMKQPDRWMIPYRILGRKPRAKPNLNDQDDDDDDDDDDAE